MSDLPNFTKDATFGDLLDPAMEIARAGDREAAAAYVQAYVAYLVEVWDRTPDDAWKVVKTNLGYWAGYYDHDVRAAVQEVFGAVHPVFGTVRPTAEQAFDAGFLYSMGIDPEADSVPPS